MEAGLQQTPSADRIHIAFFGRRNAGKSSLVNAITNQTMSIVSEIQGTTTDPVRKAMELLPLGAVVIIDTPGLDDEGTLGEERVRRARLVLDQTDIAVLVVDAAAGLSRADRSLTQLFEERHIPYVIAMNKADLITVPENIPENMIFVSARENGNIHALKEKIAALVHSVPPARELIADLVSPGDAVVLVTPIDSAAPKGRLILPQQQTIRSLLDAGCIPVVTRETELARTLSLLREPPALVVTDSQAFGMVSRIVPDSVRLTSFSILFARYKGDLRTAVLGAAALRRLKDGDTVLISEGCTHHRQCGDIGTVKLPAWLKKYTGKELNFRFTSGGEFPKDIAGIALVVHCGGCMLNARELSGRFDNCEIEGVSVTNYGIAIAKMHGILERALSVFHICQV